MKTGLRIDISAMKYPNGSENGNLIEGLCFDVPAHAVVSILGRSGAGKTTLLRMIAGLERRYQGHITLDGKAIDRPSRDLQIVFRDYRLIPWKTVYQNVDLP